MIDSNFKYPRLYGNESLVHGTTCPLDEAQAHYLYNVLRKNVGDYVRLFNGRDGEWLCELRELSKKKGAAHPVEQICVQPAPAPKLALAFAPIKKQRMDFLIEKAVELGVTDFYPVITQRTENRYLKEDRIERQMIEAAEQSERLSVPVWHKAQTLSEFLAHYDGVVLAAIERHEHVRSLLECALDQDVTLLVGSEGGWAPEEIAVMREFEKLQGVGLGAQILRAETASIAMLSCAAMMRVR